jgi:peptide/nickel transport system substrate-binding protein
MKLRLVTMIAALAAAALITPVQAKTFRFAFQGDLNALDPYALNETFTLGTLGNVMEGLVTRDKDLKIVPALAESWEIVEPTRWRFHLRKGVKFHNGEAFTADDVLFSLERALSPESNIRTRLAPKIKA